VPSAGPPKAVLATRPRAHGPPTSARAVIRTYHHVTLDECYVVEHMRGRALARPVLQLAACGHQRRHWPGQAVMQDDRVRLLGTCGLISTSIDG